MLRVGSDTLKRYCSWTPRNHYQNPRLCRVSPLCECLLSGTRQRRLCREPHSIKLGSRQRASLPSARHSAQDPTRQRHVKHSAKVAFGKGPSAAVPKLTAVSLCREPRVGNRQRVFFAECQIVGTRQRTLCRVSIFIFFLFFLPNFLWYVPTLCRTTCIICGQL
jgi:hypothetical protein